MKIRLCDEGWAIDGYPIILDNWTTLGSGKFQGTFFKFTEVFIEGQFMMQVAPGSDLTVAITEWRRNK